MKRHATRGDARQRNHDGSFLPVFDRRKRKIPGLWQRDSFYYAQLRVDLGNGRTVPRRFVKGNGYDNAMLESFWATFKAESFAGERPATRPAAKLQVFDYIEGFYHRSRLHNGLNY